ncbi:MAG: hypothetical protein GEV03_06365 [Streptosporangiales bacterium]|nr:hypothetical protein [Streptosporangiales bacterium]
MAASSAARRPASARATRTASGTIAMAQTIRQTAVSRQCRRRNGLAASDGRYSPISRWPPT